MLITTMPIAKSTTKSSWLAAEGTVTTINEFLLLAETLGINVSENGDENKSRNGNEILADLIRNSLEARTGRWLSMLDNVNNVTDVSIFTPNMGGDFIITTRDDVNKSWSNVIRVDKMSLNDTLVLLLGPENESSPSQYALKSSKRWAACCWP